MEEKKVLELNVNMKNHVQIGLFFLDKRKLEPLQTLKEYINIRTNGVILYDFRPRPHNRIVILKVENKLWYLSAAEDKNGHNYEELYFYEQTEEEIKQSLKYLHDNNLDINMTATPSEGE